ncbi:MAG: methionine adenosyltransferase [Candidatus Aenigmarchaeota archaeon]|nr:methionine adenosyltransferase [Candidatus Aenigmarchaeota archaeon]MDW8159882.1 methionine adenosyltransferase [Candidatus Aenigmarchaeota archaeon]
MKNLRISQFRYIEPRIEIVERKGIGHPDTICDSIADQISVELAKYYLKKFGRIFHYNVDKALLSAGEAKTKFGGGKIIKPMKLVFGDRATYKVGNEEVPIFEIVKNSAINWFKTNLRFVGEENLQIVSEIKFGSEELTSIFSRKEKFLPANDTSALVGYAPLTTLEKSVLELEKYLNSKGFKERYPWSGEDIKVMGMRDDSNFTYTIAMAFVDRYVESESDYFRKKEEILAEINRFLKEKFDISPRLFMNTLDERGKGEEGCYLTVTGTSAESADSGEVGRGNRVNGLICLNRPAGSEAAAGKNMVSHVGKIYNILAFDIANKIYEEIGKHTYVWLLSQIGRPINDPLVISVEVDRLEKDDEKKIVEIVEKRFETLKDFIQDLIDGKFKVC